MCLHDNTQPDYVKDKLEMPPIAKESSEDLPLVQPDREERFHPEECFISESLTAENEEPQSKREALDGENSGKWKEALVVYYNITIH